MGTSKRISNRLALSIILFGLGIQCPSLAQVPIVKDLKDLDGDQFCSSDGGPASKYLLSRAIIDHYGVPYSLVDWDDTGVNYDRYARAVSTLLCDDGPDALVHTKKCYSAKGNTVGNAGLKQLSAGAQKQWDTVQDVRRALRRAAKQGRNFTLPLKGWTLSFKHNADVSPSDALRSTLREADGSLSLAGEVFSSDPKFFDVTCIKAASPNQKPPKPTPGGEQPQPADDAQGAQISQEVILNPLRVRGTADDLSIGRTDALFKGVSSASIAANNDIMAKKNSFDVHLAVGYVWSVVQYGGFTLHTIPYLKYDRDYISGDNASKTSSNVNNIGVGLLEKIQLPKGFYGSVFIQPDYTESLRSNVKIGKLQLAWQPEPLLPYFGYASPTGIPGISATMYGRAVLRIGKVFEKSNDDTLAMTNTFTQAGAQVGATFLADESSMLKGFSIPINYTNYYGFVGEYRSIPHFETGITYTMPTTKYVTINLSHTAGRNLDTFEKQRLYKLSLGLRY